MPKAVVHTHVTHDPFVTKVLNLGYQPVKRKETAQILSQLEAISPYIGKEPSMMEEGFTYFKNGLRVYIWTSYVRAEDSTRVGWDSGKDVITESSKVEYYGPEVRRTENFYERLLHRAIIQKMRVDNRPTCKHCKKLMRIRYTKNHQYYWYCEGFYVDETHPWISAKWDIGLDKLPAESMKFLKDRRERTRKYNKLRVKQNLPKRGTARLRKKSWKYLNRVK